MIREPKHGRKLVIGGVSLTMARLPKFTGKELEAIRDDFEVRLIYARFFENMPFTWISFIVRYGLKNDTSADLGIISKKYGDLPVSIEMDINDLVGEDRKKLGTAMRWSVETGLNYIRSRYNVPPF